MGCKLIVTRIGDEKLKNAVEDDTPLDQGGSEKYRVVRQKEFYGLGFEEWLALTVKVNSARTLQGCKADTAVLLCLDGQR